MRMSKTKLFNKAQGIASLMLGDAILQKAGEIMINPLLIGVDFPPKDYSEEYAQEAVDTLSYHGFQVERVSTRDSLNPFEERVEKIRSSKKKEAELEDIDPSEIADLIGLYQSNQHRIDEINDAIKVISDGSSETTEEVSGEVEIVEDSPETEDVPVVESGVDSTTSTSTKESISKVKKGFWNRQNLRILRKAAKEEGMDLMTLASKFNVPLNAVMEGIRLLQVSHRLPEDFKLPVKKISEEVIESASETGENREEANTGLPHDPE